MLTLTDKHEIRFISFRQPSFSLFIAPEKEKIQFGFPGEALALMLIDWKISSESQDFHTGIEMENGLNWSTTSS